MRGLIPAALIAAGALVEVGAQFAIVARVPSDADWRAAAAHVRTARRDGDGIAFAPRWVDPVGRLQFGDLVSLEEAARPDRSRQARIWEVSVRGAAVPAAASARVAEERLFGFVRVRLLVRRAAEVLYDFTERARDARADARAIVAEVGFSPVRCLLAPPPRKLRFPAVPLGSRIAVHAGIHDFQSRYQSDAPVTLIVRAGGEPIARLVHRQERGWEASAIDTARFSGRTLPVEIEVAADRPAHRTLCFHAEAQR